MTKNKDFIATSEEQIEMIKKYISSRLGAYEIESFKFNQEVFETWHYSKKQCRKGVLLITPKKLRHVDKEAENG